MQRTTRIASAALLAVAAMTNHAYAQVACTAGKIPITFTGKALTNSVTNSGDGSIAPTYPGLDFGNAADRTLNTLGTASIRSTTHGIKLSCGVRGTITEFDPSGFPVIEARFFSHAVCGDHAQLDFDVATTVTFVSASCPSGSYFPAPYGTIGLVEEQGALIGTFGAFNGATGTIALSGTSACGLQDLDITAHVCLTQEQIKALKAKVD